MCFLPPPPYYTHHFVGVFDDSVMITDDHDDFDVEDECDVSYGKKKNKNNVFCTIIEQNYDTSLKDPSNIASFVLLY